MWFFKKPTPPFEALRPSLIAVGGAVTLDTVVANATGMTSCIDAFSCIRLDRHLNKRHEAFFIHK